MKHLRETFTDEEFQQLKNIKGNQNWHDFILRKPQESPIEAIVATGRLLIRYISYALISGVPREKLEPAIELASKIIVFAKEAEK